MMPLICPACGGRMDIEPERKLVPYSCPYCRAALAPITNGQAVVLKVVPVALAFEENEVAVLLKKAGDESDPVKRYALLTKAEQAAPQDLRVQKALLKHGRLHERNKHRVDFSIIKCYLLHVFEEPQAHTTTQQAEMIRELFFEERLIKALELADHPEAFLLEYLTELSREYIRLFLQGSNRYMKSIFGFSAGGKPAKLLAVPSAAMIKRMFHEPLMTQDQRKMLSQAFYAAFEQEFDGETVYLDESLGGLMHALHTDRRN